MIELYPQTLLNLKVKEKRDLNTMPAYVKALAAAEKELAGKGRIFVRYSGTEPKLRILVESEVELTNERIAYHLSETITEAFN